MGDGIGQTLYADRDNRGRVSKANGGDGCSLRRLLCSSGASVPRLDNHSLHSIGVIIARHHIYLSGAAMQLSRKVAAGTCAGSEDLHHLPEHYRVPVTACLTQNAC